MTRKEEIEMIERLAARLAEHYDAVQILVSNCEHDGTRYLARGHGNWYARTGMAREFLKTDYQTDQAKRIVEEEEESPGED